MADNCQSNFVIYKKYIHGVGYTFGYSEQGRKLEQWCAEVEVVQFQQYQGEAIFSNNIGEEPIVAVSEESKPRATKRGSTKRDLPTA